MLFEHLAKVADVDGAIRLTTNDKHRETVAAFSVSHILDTPLWVLGARIDDAARPGLQNRALADEYQDAIVRLAYVIIGISLCWSSNGLITANWLEILYCVIVKSR